jgi:RNA polymerase sigma factor (sigma-70 family)
MRGMRTMTRGAFSGTFIQHLERLFEQGTATGLSEGELLERFVRGRDESAFEALIARHGPMVLGVCSHLLRDPNDVDDAFQATFLVLVRKAGTLRRCDLLGNWLYGVAYRVATRARVLAAKRTARAPFGQEMVDRLDANDRRPGATGDETSGPVPAEPRPWLHEEVARLPEKYRGPVTLCYFEGLTHEQAAQRLGWPLGTVKGRLARARELLRKRLIRRGVTLSATAMAAHLALPAGRAAVSASLASATIKAAVAVRNAAGASIGGVSTISLPVVSLTQGALQAMTLSQVKSVVGAMLVVCAVAAGLVIGAPQITPREEQTQPPGQAVPRREAFKVSLATQNGAFEKTAKAVASSPSSQSQKAASPRADGPADSAGRGGPMPGGGRTGMGGMAGGGVRMMVDGALAGVESVEEAHELRRRLEIAQLSAALPMWQANPKNEATLKLLEEPLAMSFAKETPLAEVLEYIKKSVSAKHGGSSTIPIYVDPVGLKKVERNLDSVVVIDLNGAPLKTSLRLILKQLGLAYCVRDGVLIISSTQGIREELSEAARELFGTEERDNVDMRLLGPMPMGRLDNPQ